MLLMSWLFVGEAEAGRPSSPEKVEAMRQRREGKLVVGQPAPDVPVVKLDGTPVTLSALRRTDRPTVLVFGSFT